MTKNATELTRKKHGLLLNFTVYLLIYDVLSIRFSEHGMTITDIEREMVLGCKVEKINLIQLGLGH